MPDRKSISEFIVFEENHERVIFEIKDNRMVSFSVDHRLGHCVGDIIIGKVSGIVKNIQGVFLKIAADTTCFMSMEDCKNPILLNRVYDGRLKENDEIVVQIRKEAYKKKLACVDTKLELVSDFFVIYYDGDCKKKYSFSKKLSAEKKSEILSELSALPEGVSFADGIHVLFRTECEKEELDKIKDKLIKEVSFLEELLKKAKHLYPYSVLYKKDGIFETKMKASFSKGDCKWVTEQKMLYEEMLRIAQENAFSKSCISFYEDENVPLQVLYGLKNKLKNITDEKIWLQNGASLYITPTEALTIIDVNSGKCTEKGDKEETYLKINSEAALEIAHQIRARNLSGIILVDFINLKEEKHRTILLELLKENLKALSPPGIVVDITKLGIIEIVRKKETADIYEYLHLFNKTILI